MTTVAPYPQTAGGDEAATPEVILAASMVPQSRPRWMRVLSQLSHLWLLVVLILVWELGSRFGKSVNPQLDVMLPPPTAVFSAAQDLWARGVLIVRPLAGFFVRNQPSPSMRFRMVDGPLAVLTC